MYSRSFSPLAERDSAHPGWRTHLCLLRLFCWSRYLLRRKPSICIHPKLGRRESWYGLILLAPFPPSSSPYSSLIFCVATIVDTVSIVTDVPVVTVVTVVSFVFVVSIVVS